MTDPALVLQRTNWRGTQWEMTLFKKEVEEEGAAAWKACALRRGRNFSVLITASAEGTCGCKRKPLAVFFNEALIEQAQLVTCLGNVAPQTVSKQLEHLQLWLNTCQCFHIHTPVHICKLHLHILTNNNAYFLYLYSHENKCAGIIHQEPLSGQSRWHLQNWSCSR